MSRILIWEEADPKVLGHFFKAVVQAVLLFWGRDVGPDPPDGAGPDHISAQGRAMAHQEAAEAEGGGALVISSADGVNDGSGLQGDRDLRHEEAEYGRAIYCDATDSGTL